jgi:hypothetical protein
MAVRTGVRKKKKKWQWWKSKCMVTANNKGVSLKYACIGGNVGCDVA